MDTLTPAQQGANALTSTPKTNIFNTIWNIFKPTLSESSQNIFSTQAKQWVRALNTSVLKEKLNIFNPAKVTYTAIKWAAKETAKFLWQSAEKVWAWVTWLIDKFGNITGAWYVKPKTTVPDDIANIAMWGLWWTWAIHAPKFTAWIALAEQAYPKVFDKIFTAIAGTSKVMEDSLAWDIVTKLWVSDEVKTEMFQFFTSAVLFKKAADAAWFVGSRMKSYDTTLKLKQSLSDTYAKDLETLWLKWSPWEQAIKARAVELAKVAHPDVKWGNKELFQEIMAARDRLLKVPKAITEIDMKIAQEMKKNSTDMKFKETIDLLKQAYDKTKTFLSTPKQWWIDVNALAGKSAEDMKFEDFLKEMKWEVARQDIWWIDRARMIVEANRIAEMDAKWISERKRSPLQETLKENIKQMLSTPEYEPSNDEVESYFESLLNTPVDQIAEAQKLVTNAQLKWIKVRSPEVKAREENDKLNIKLAKGWLSELQVADIKAQIKANKQIIEQSQKPTQTQQVKPEKGKVGERKVLTLESNDRYNPTLEVIKNPTGSDIRQLDNEYRKDYPWRAEQWLDPITRSTYDELWNEYMWRSDKALHPTVEKQLKKLYWWEYNQTKSIVSKPTQTQLVKQLLTKKEVPMPIKQVADETGIKEANIRRILGQGEKVGEFTRVGKGVYTVETKEGTKAIIHVADALETVKKLVADWIKMDMVFMDIPYNTAAVKWWNRGRTYDLISVEYFKELMDNVAKILKDKQTPVYFMFSNAKSWWKQMQQYIQVLKDHWLKHIATGWRQKLFQSGKPVTNVRWKVAEPEWISLYNMDWVFRDKEIRNLDFVLTRPKWLTEKPVEMMTSLIKQGTNVWDIVYDPFAGAGPIVEAALKEWRNVIVSEKSPEQAQKIIDRTKWMQVEKKPAIPLNEYQYMTPSEQNTMKTVIKSKTLTDTQKTNIINKAVESVKTRMAGEEKAMSDKQIAQEKAIVQARQKWLKQEVKFWKVGKNYDADKYFQDTPLGPILQPKSAKVAKQLKKELGREINLTWKDKDIRELESYLKDLKEEWKDVPYFTRFLRERWDNAYLKHKFGAVGKTIYEKFQRSDQWWMIEGNLAMQPVLEEMWVVDSKSNQEIYDAISRWETPKQYEWFINAWRETAANVASLARKYWVQVRKLDGSKKPFEAKRNYIPLVLKAEIKDQLKTQKAEKIAQRIVRIGAENGKEIDIAEARAAVKFIKSPITRFGNLEYEASNNILPKEWIETDLTKILPNYIQGAYRRMWDIIEFGPNDEILKSLMSIAQDKWYNTQLMDQLINRIKGTEDRKWKEHMDWMVTQMRKWISAWLLQLNAVQNLWDVTKSFIRNGAWNTAKAIWIANTKKWKLTSDLVWSSKYDVSQYASAYGLWEKIYKWTGQQWVEQIVRSIDGLAAIESVKSDVRKLVKNPNNLFNKSQRRNITNHGLDVEQILKQWWITPRQELDVAANSLFESQPVWRTSVPHGWKGNAGKIFTQFYSFGYQQMKFIFKHIGKELMKGNVYPLVRFIIFGQLLGETVSDLLAMVRWKKRPDSLLNIIFGDRSNPDYKEWDLMKALINNQLQTWWIGLIYTIVSNIMSSLEYNRAAWPIALMGTAVSLAGSLWYAAYHDISWALAWFDPRTFTFDESKRKEAVVGKVANKWEYQLLLLKQIIKMTSPAGPILSEKFAPSKNTTYQDSVLLNKIFPTVKQESTWRTSWTRTSWGWRESAWRTSGR